MARIITYTPLMLLVMLGACSHMPTPQPAPTPVALTDANGNPIPPRPTVFGRHAWDLQYGDAARQAEARAQQGTAQASVPPPPVVPPAPPPVAQPAPPPVVAMAPPPPPAPVIQAPPPPAPAPVIAAAPAPVVQAPPPPPAYIAPPPPPVVAVAPVAPPPPPAPAPVPPAPPVQVAEAPPPPPAPVQPAAPAQQKGLFTILKELRTAPPPPVTGGYQTPTDMKAVRAAADFAVKAATFYDFSALYSAKVQVVAGTNYSLCLWVRQKEHEANPLHRRMVSALVFQGLDGHYELTSWQEVNTCHAGS